MACRYRGGALGLLALLVVAVGCSPAPSKVEGHATSASAAAVPTVVPAVTPTAVGSATAVPAGAPLFRYSEDGDTVSFWPPRAVRIDPTRPAGDRSCDSELSDNGNMYTGADVEAAFRNDDVQAALRGPAVYGVGKDATLRTTEGDAGAGTLEWRAGCRACLPEPPGVARLREVLAVVVSNRRLLCP